MSMILQVVDGKEAIPLRALPFVTSGVLDGLTLAEFALADAANWQYPTLEFFVRGPDGSISSVSTGSLVRMNKEMCGARADSLEQQRRRIPPGVLIWVDEARALYSAVARDSVDCMTGEADFRIGSWSLAPLLSVQELEFILEGVRGASIPSHKPASRGKLLSNGADPSLKPLAIQIAQELQPRQRHKLTRVQVAAVLAARISMDKATAERRIRASWW